MRIILLLILVIGLSGCLFVAAGYVGKLKRRNSRLEGEMERQAMEKAAKAEEAKKKS